MNLGRMKVGETLLDIVEIRLCHGRNRICRSVNGIPGFDIVGQVTGPIPADRGRVTLFTNDRAQVATEGAAVIDIPETRGTLRVTYHLGVFDIQPGPPTRRPREGLL
ncbi:MAG TPA: hypothetical protein VNN79_09065 [Actinomycetota bacterium]|nr:hypothetical protein [Actinomycetota bacterium]